MVCGHSCRVCLESSKTGAHACGERSFLAHLLRSEALLKSLAVGSPQDWLPAPMRLSTACVLGDGAVEVIEPVAGDLVGDASGSGLTLGQTDLDDLRVGEGDARDDAIVDLEALDAEAPPRRSTAACVP